MTQYYVTLQTKSHAFLLERRMKQMGIKCSLVFLPREIMKDLCSMGVSFYEDESRKAIEAVKNSGLPDFKVYKAITLQDSTKYMEIPL